MNTDKIFQSQHYLFVFKVEADEEQAGRFINEVETRLYGISELLGYSDKIIETRPVYIIDKTDDIHFLHGNGSRQCIHLYVNQLDEINGNINLAIHEETHYILSNLCPEISTFLNEGIAEYVCWKYTGRRMPDAFMSNMKYIREISEEMVLSRDNWMKEYQARGIWIYGVASLFIKTMLSARHTVREILHEVYSDGNISVISETLEACRMREKVRV
jgi:hypothetical protein